MSIFADLDFDSVPDDPFYMPDNSYLTYVTKVKTGQTQAGDKFGMTITYRVAEGAFEGREITEWKRIPQPSDPAHPSDDDLKAMTWLKSRLKDLGVPNDRMSELDPEDLIGIKCVVAVKNKGEYRNVTKITTVDEDFSLDDASMTDFDV